MSQEKKIAVLLDVSRKYDRDMVRGVLQLTLEHSGWTTFILPPSFIDDTSPELLLKQCHGLAGVIARDNEGWEFLKSLGVPVVLVPFHHRKEGVINVINDNKGIGALAAEYFLSKGYSHFAYYGNNTCHWSNDRREAFSSELENHGMSCSLLPDEIRSLRWDRRNAHLKEWLSVQKLPLAVFCATDEYASQVLDVVKTMGLSSPQDVAVMGVDNDDIICDLSQPSLSSFDPNSHLAGYLSAKKIIHLNATEQEDYSDLLIPHGGIVKRNSTDMFAIEDKEVLKALRFIAEHMYDKNIGVVDVVAATAVSRRLLEGRFKEATQYSIQRYVRTKRIEFIKKLLLETNQSVKEIAARMDFTSLESISRFFKNETGWSPSDFRKAYRV